MFPEPSSGRPEYKAEFFRLLYLARALVADADDFCYEYVIGNPGCRHVVELRQRNTFKALRDLCEEMRLEYEIGG